MTEPVDTPQLVDLTAELSVAVKQATEEQMAVLFKNARAAQRDIERNGLQALDTLFRVVERVLVDPDTDIQRLDDALLDGKLTIKDLLKVFTMGEDVDKPTPAKRTRRGATR